MPTLVKPAPLRPGDLVGVVAPASPCPAQEIEAGRSVLEKLGLRVAMRVDEEDFRPGYLAGSDEYRASSFNKSIQDPEIKALFCLRGGYGSLRILSSLSYEQLRLTPKPVVGFSDLTALLLACHGRAGVVCFHGPTVSSLAKIDPESVESLWTALSSTEPIALHFPKAVCLRPGKALGPVLGGNLTTLCHLLGTVFFPALSGTILFLEDRGEPLYRIDRMLTQLIHVNSLVGLAALMLGDFSESGPRQELDELVQERLKSTSFPIISGVPVGHEERNLTLPLGLSASLDTDSSTLTYHQVATMS
ncbi:MAG: LD-carboxypeptidase [Deltaproteobacteria bacterium]|nr:MAG: LD-carboxypeptidase [Deltaproteobacteria bacterium]